MIRRYLSLAFLFIPTLAFAAAGFADRFHEHRQWILPAYYYCLIFGLIILLGMFDTTMIFKTKTKKITGTISDYLVGHRILAISVTGVLWSIILGIAGSVLWEYLWVASILPVLVLMVAFPLSLVNRRFREKRLVSPSRIKWTFMITMSAIAASLLFIILTNYDMLPGTDGLYYDGYSVGPRQSHYRLHPYDSIMEIWSTTLFFIMWIPIAIVLYWLGKLNQYLCRKLSAIRHRKRQTFTDVYFDE